MFSKKRKGLVLSDTPECYGDYSETKTACFNCVEREGCREKTLDIEEKEIVEARLEIERARQKSEATKLDSGKRKLSLVHPCLFSLLIQTDNPRLSPICAAMENICIAAHAQDADHCIACLEEAVVEIIEYLQGGQFEALEQLTVAMEYGASKPEYGRNNWKKGMEWSRLADAALRHGLRILAGESVDQDSGNRHVAHMLASIHMLLGNIALGVGKNDLFEGGE